MDESFDKMLESVKVALAEQQASQQHASEMHDVRVARLNLACVLIEKGADPNDACVKAKQLVIKLYGEVES